jgi:LCP family protein required for cell wall assembly
MARRRGGSGSPWLLRFLTVLGVLLMLTAGGTFALINGVSARYGALLARADLLGGIPRSDGSGGATNYLILGGDSRTAVPETQPSTPATEGPTTGPTTAPADPTATAGPDDPGATQMIMLLHIPRDRDVAYLIAIPRDSLLEVPAGGTWPGGLTTLGAAMDLGGPNLVARAIYDLSQVPLDGALIVDFGGVPDMVDAVGGVNVCTPFEVRSFFTDTTWAAGCHDMTASEADEFMGPRVLVPGGEIGRMINQQNVIMAVLAKATTTEVLTSPTIVNALFTRGARSLTVDDRLDVRDLLFTLKGIGPGNLRFAAVPIVGSVQTESGPALDLDTPAAEELFSAVRDETLGAWLAAHPPELSGGGPP